MRLESDFTLLIFCNITGGMGEMFVSVFHVQCRPRPLVGGHILLTEAQATSGRLEV